MAKAKIGRNAPCPCGSGKKFKNCCLPRAVPPPRSGQWPPADPWAARVDSAIRRAGTPHGTPVPSIIWKGYRFRAVGSRLHSRPPGETFHEFIVHQVKWTLGKEWHDEQIKRPPDQRHQILKWFDAMHELLMRSGSDSGNREGVRSARASGDAWALLTLAYDIFHLLHRGDLPGGLVDRLRKEDQFQGSRYEVAVAAIFVRAGFEVKFVAAEGSKKRCDFIAHDPATGIDIAVEVKSRHRAGVLGQPGQIEEAKAVRGDVEGLINDALEQNPGNMPFMIFIDVNVPPVPGIPIQERAWFRDIWDSMQSVPAPAPTRPDEANALVFTNFAYHWDGSKPTSGTEYLYIASQHPKYPLTEALLGRIMAAVAAYGDVPVEM